MDEHSSLEKNHSGELNIQKAKEVRDLQSKTIV